MLSPKQQRVFDFIKRVIIAGNDAPTMKEIGAQCRIRSSAQVFEILTTLENLGLIERSRQHRGIKLIDRA